MKTIPQASMTWPPDYEFQLPDGRRVSGVEFTERYAGIPGRYPVWRGDRRIGTYTNHGPLDIKRIISKLGI